MPDPTEPSAVPAVPALAPSALPERHPQQWAAATAHRFLDGVRDGTLPVAALDTWLAQDALFVADLLAFQARLLARAPRAAQAVLAGGAVALVEELDWFEALAAERGLDLGVPPRAATRRYADLLARLDSAPYADALAGLWVVERVYLDAWTRALPGGQGFAVLVEHWTTPGFAAYVSALEQLADAAAAGAAGGVDDALLLEVLQQEADFWETAFEVEPTAPPAGGAGR